MSDDEQQLPGPDLDEAPGWYVTDPDGNIVESGPLTHAEAAFDVGEALDGMEE